MDHTHEWNIVPGHSGQYVCECGATGFRPQTGGPVVQHKRPRAYTSDATARLTHHLDLTAATRRQYDGDDE